MNIRNLLVLGLFWSLFLQGGTAYSEDSPPYSMSAAELDTSLGAADAPAMKDFVRVVYFHRVPGCANCQKMARYVYVIVKNDFAQDAAARRLVLRYIPFEDPRFAAMAEAFQVKSPTLVLIRVRNGKDVSAKKLSQIWALCSDETKFHDYVEQEIRDFQEEPKP